MDGIGLQRTPDLIGRRGQGQERKLNAFLVSIHVPNGGRPMLVAAAFASLSPSSPVCLGLDNLRLLAACRRVCCRLSQFEGEAVHTWSGRTNVATCVQHIRRQH